MPIYDFRCTSCGHEFELLVRSNTELVCPKCAAVALERCVSAPVAPGKSKAIIQAGRQRAAREGHLSNFSKKERGG